MRHRLWIAPYHHHLYLNFFLPPPPRHDDSRLWYDGLLSFQERDTQLDIFLAQNQYSKRKRSYFVKWHSGELSKNAKIWLSESIFYIKNYVNLSKLFFIEKYTFSTTFFCYRHFFTMLILKIIYFLKWYPIFDNSQLQQFTKYNNFDLEYWFQIFSQKPN